MVRAVASTVIARPAAEIRPGLRESIDEMRQQAPVIDAGESNWLTSLLGVDRNIDYRITEDSRTDSVRFETTEGRIRLVFEVRLEPSDRQTGVSAMMEVRPAGLIGRVLYRIGRGLLADIEAEMTRGLEELLEGIRTDLEAPAVAAGPDGAGRGGEAV